MTIRIFVTGGTFDKEYDEITGRLFFKETHVPEMLRLGRSRVPIALTPLMLIDSLDMSDVDREQIVATCRMAVEERIVITHGTDTTGPTRGSRAWDPRWWTRPRRSQLVSPARPSFSPVRRAPRAAAARGTRDGALRLWQL